MFSRNSLAFSMIQPFALLHFFFLWMTLVTTICTVLQTSIHSSSYTLSDVIPWIYLSLPLYNHKGFDLGHTWMAQWFSLHSLSVNFAMRSFWSEPQSAPGVIFADFIELLYLQLQRTYLISVLAIWWCPCVELSLGLLEKSVCYDQCVLLTKLC